MNSQQERSSLIEKIQEIRNSTVVCLVTSDRPGLSTQLDGQFVRHVYDLASEAHSIDKTKGLDLFIYSRGGDSNVPWALMSMLREVAPNVNIDVLIPYRAHSAATIAALGADHIVLGPKAELGPIDTTMISPYNPPNPTTGQPLPISVEDVMGYFSLLERIGCTGSDSKIQGLREFTQKVHPYALGMVQRLEDQTKLVASQLLSSRRDPFPEPENKAIVDAVAKRINSHEHAISRTEAVKHIGLRNVVRAEDVHVAELLWKLYEQYEGVFSLSQHFNPEEEFFRDQALEEKDYPDLPVACVETSIRSRVWLHSIHMKRRRQPIQNFTVSPQIQLPAINIAPGVDPGQVHAMVQHWLQNVLPATLQSVVHDAVEKVARSAPTLGFERREDRSRWIDTPAAKLDQAGQDAQKSPQPSKKASRAKTK